MANGQQLAEDNVLRFATWVASKTDHDFRDMTTRGVLSRSEIAAECGFARSALVQNPRIRDSLTKLEDELRHRGVLPPMIAKPAHEAPASAAKPVFSNRAARDAERLKRLEQENASLRAELIEVKSALSRYALLQDALAETGRLPR